MTQKNEKISIQPHELAPPVEPIVSAPIRVKATAELPTASPASVLLNSVIPFWNAWWWYRRRTPRGRIHDRLIAAVMLAASVALVAGVIWATTPSQRHWVESIYDRIDKSVVKVMVADRRGTGFVIASQPGQHLLITNLHVISSTPVPVDRDATIRISTKSGAELPARLVGYTKDPHADLALCLVDAGDLEPLGPIRPFPEVRIGEKVAAVGHPLGYEYSITEGIVSGKRDALVIQTSAPISRGNSGGPLIDAHGLIVGVNTRGVDARAGQLLSFAVRADLVLQRHEWIYLSDVSGLLDCIAQ